MAGYITLMAKNEAYLVLLTKDVETFLDGNFETVGKQKAPPKGFGDNLVDIIQSTSMDVTTQLIKPDGTNFDLTGVTSVQLMIYQRTPTRQLVSATAGTPTGMLTDGLVLFPLSDADTNYIGFATGVVTCVKNSRHVGFELFSVRYTENPTVPLP